MLAPLSYDGDTVTSRGYECLLFLVLFVYVAKFYPNSRESFVFTGILSGIRGSVLATVIFHGR